MSFFFPHDSLRACRSAILAVLAVALAGCANQPAATSFPPPKLPMKVAFVYVGPIGDAGWTYAHEQGRLQLQQALGDKIRSVGVERVAEGDERVFRDLAVQGNDMIFATTYGYGEPLRRVAARHPDVRFEHATGFRMTPNIGIYNVRLYEAAYLGGIVAGRMSPGGRLGVVGSVPIPEVIANINAFTRGARSVNPHATVQVYWVGEWFNPPKEAQAARELIGNGAEVLFANTNSSAVLETAQRLGKRAFGLDSDMRAFAPRAHLGSVVVNWGPYYIRTVQDALDGTWRPAANWWGLKEGAVDLVSLADDIPAETRARLAAVKNGHSDGSFDIWAAPLWSNDGRLVLETGEVAGEDLLLGMDFYVEGVRGKVPASGGFQPGLQPD